MIIAIDEKGMFDLKSNEINFFIGVHFTNETERGVALGGLMAWKEKYRSLKNHQGEIKGSSIDDKIATDFVDMVIMPNRYLYITACGTRPSEHNEEIIKFHRDHHINCLDRGIQQCREVGNSRLADQYTELRNWYKKLNNQLLLKNFILAEMIGFSFIEHVVQVILDNQDRTLGTIQIKIDEDFVRQPQTIIFWKDLLRSHFYSYTYQHPIPILKEWPDDHPFYAARNKPKGSRILVDVDNVFRNGCNFVRSHEHPEIQIADILASIIGGYQNKKIFRSSYSRVRSKMIPIRRSPITLFRMASPKNSHPDSAPNPYEMLRQ